MGASHSFLSPSGSLPGRAPVFRFQTISWKPIAGFHFAYIHPLGGVDVPLMGYDL